MASTTTAPTNQTSLYATPSIPNPMVQYYPVLLGIHCVVLIISFIGLSQMWQLIEKVRSRSQKGSATIYAVLNLIFAHLIYFITLPFRIYYYAVGQWYLTIPWCKIVSSMIFIHMYMSFIFYFILIVTRLLTYRGRSVEIYRPCQAIILCVAVWLVVLVAVPLVVYFKYGKVHGEDDSRCFHFGGRISGEMGAKAFNYVTSGLIIGATLVLVVLQTAVQVKVCKKLGSPSNWGKQQEFWRQMKSSVFVLIMVVCFLPYNMFRLHYIENLHLQGINEVFLSLTTLNCMDMFTFVKRVKCTTCCD